MKLAMKEAILIPKHKDFHRRTDVYQLKKSAQKKKAILYYVKVFYKDKVYYKIGITTQHISDRMRELLRKTRGIRIEIVDTYMFQTGKEAQDVEWNLHIVHKEWKYRGVDILASGNSELYVKDVLGLDS